MYNMCVRAYVRACVRARARVCMVRVEYLLQVDLVTAGSQDSVKKTSLHFMFNANSSN